MMPSNAQIKKILEANGMVNCYYKSLSGGIACIVVGFKPGG
jgi:demethylmenaquinone methyltransferase/2-methoxy-6-polyprenyl-1,4-benzoquinol methylase